MKLSPLLAIGLLAAQSPAFEVATVKPIDPNPNAMHSPGVTIFPGGRVAISDTELKGLISIAFHISYWQISGGEPWVEKDKFDLEAKPPAESRISC